MDARALDRRITIESATVARNDNGEPITTWSTLATIWAKRMGLRGAELFATNQVVAQAQCKYRIRWRDDINESMRVVDDGVTFGIQHIADPADLGAKVSRRQWLDLTVRRPE